VGEGEGANLGDEGGGVAEGDGVGDADEGDEEGDGVGLGVVLEGGMTLTSGRFLGLGAFFSGVGLAGVDWDGGAIATCLGGLLENREEVVHKTSTSTPAIAPVRALSDRA